MQSKEHKLYIYLPKRKITGYLYFERCTSYSLATILYRFMETKEYTIDMLHAR